MSTPSPADLLHLTSSSVILQMGQATSSAGEEEEEEQDREQHRGGDEEEVDDDHDVVVRGHQELQGEVQDQPHPHQQQQQHVQQSGGARSRGGHRVRSSAGGALQNILSVLVGRGGLNRIPAGAESDSYSSSSGGDGESDQDFWPPMRRPRSNKAVRPDRDMLKALEDSDFTLLTKLQLHSNIPCRKESGTAAITKTKKACYFTRCRKSNNDKAAADGKEDVPPSATSSTDYNNPNPSTSSSFSGRDRDQNWNIPGLVARKELGDFRRGRRDISHGQKCQVLSNFLPNQKKLLGKFSQKLFCGSYSKCGDLFMSACQDQNIRLYDTKNGGFRLIKTIRARSVGWSVLDTALSPDNQHLIYSSWCDYIHQVNVYGEEDRHVSLPLSPEDGRFCLFSLRFSQDGCEILGGANDGYLYLFDRMSNTESMKINAHDDDVNAVAFADSTTHILASGGDDGVCKIWDRRSLRESRPTPVGILAGHVDGITFIDPRGDGRHLITNSKDQSIKLWDIRRFSPAEAVDETRRAVGNQNWDYRWQGVPKHLARSERRPVVRNDSSVMTYRGHTVLQTLIRCHFSPQHTTGQRYIYTGCATGAVVVYDALTGEVVRENRGHSACVRDVSWHPYQPEMISSSWDFKINKWTYVPEDIQEEQRILASKKSAAGAAGGRDRPDCCPSSRKSARLVNLLRRYDTPDEDEDEDDNPVM